MIKRESGEVLVHERQGQNQNWILVIFVLSINLLFENVNRVMSQLAITHVTTILVYRTESAVCYTLYDA